MRLFDSGDEVSCVVIAIQPRPTDALFSHCTSCRGVIGPSSAARLGPAETLVGVIISKVLFWYDSEKLLRPFKYF